MINSLTSVPSYSLASQTPWLNTGGLLLNDPKIAFVFAKRTDGRTYLAYQEFPVITATQGNIVQFSNVRIIINGSEQAVAQVRPCRRAVR